MLTQKAAKPFLAGLLLLVSIALCVITLKGGLLVGLLILAALVSLPMVYCIVAYPKFGTIVLILASYFLMLFVKFSGDFPVGTIMDALEYLLIIGFFFKQKYRRDWEIFNNPISYFILAWIGYNFIEAFNPNAASILAWVYTVRTVAVVMIMYFIFVFHINSIGFIKFILKLWLLLSLTAGIYGIIQEVHGYANFEWIWLRKNPVSMQLYFILGHWRKFSIFSDPVTFAYDMVLCVIICISLIRGPIKTYKKFVLGVIALICFISMLFSGTRGAYVMIPATLGMLMLLNLTKRTFIVGTIVAAIFAVIIIMPTYNPVLLRFQSAFKPSEDASFNVRARNQAFIQPYIQTHSIGGGLGATGIWGARFAPDSELAKFPPDSGYVRVAVEMGWIGLLLFCSLVFVVLYTGINNYFTIKDPVLKNYCLCMTLIIFALNIGNYPQQAIVQFPTNIWFYLAIALITVLKRLDTQQQALNETVVVDTPLRS